MTDPAGNPTVPRDREEERLAAGLQTRDPACVEEFVRRTHRPVYAMASRLTNDPDLRHDWSQEVLLRILDEMARGRFVYRHPGCFWSWFRTRAHFQLLNLLAKQRKQNRRWQTGEAGEERVDEMPGAGADVPLDRLEALEARRVIEECLEELSSDDHRQALSRLLFQEQRYDEIAQQLGATLNTVRSWIRRARIAVRQCVERKFSADGSTES